MTEQRRKKLREALQEVREQYHRWIADAVRHQPNMSYSEIAKLFGCSEATVYQVARLSGISRNGHKDSSDVLSDEVAS